VQRIDWIEEIGCGLSSMLFYAPAPDSGAGVFLFLFKGESLQPDLSHHQKAVLQLSNPTGGFST